MLVTIYPQTPQHVRTTLSSVVALPLPVRVYASVRIEKMVRVCSLNRTHAGDQPVAQHSAYLWQLRCHQHHCSG